MMLSHQSQSTPIFSSVWAVETATAAGSNRRLSRSVAMATGGWDSAKKSVGKKVGFLARVPTER